MAIEYKKDDRQFHLYNRDISYVISIMQNEQVGQLYFGARLPINRSYTYLLETAPRYMTSYSFEGDWAFSPEHIRQEYPAYGAGDYRQPAVELLQENGSRISGLRYVSHRIFSGKPTLEGLPATYVEEDDEADSLEICLKDDLCQTELYLLYTIFAGCGAVARSARFVQPQGTTPVMVDTAMSLCVDLPGRDYEMVQLSGAWARERSVITRPLQQGIQSIGSRRGISSANHNPFLALTRPGCTEHVGQVYGFSLVYSGNFLAQAEVTTHDETRVLLGIHPDGFCWQLAPGQTLQTPEAVAVFSSNGYNGMSQIYHRLYQNRLCRGPWRDKPRPILINNWEATYFGFDEEKLLAIAQKAKQIGVELFVLDDGWFGKRDDDTTSLGDWQANLEKLPGGIAGLAKRVQALGLDFGLWFEPEMVNKDSELYRAHPDWVLHTPQRPMCHGRNQYVLDMARPEVVECLYTQMAAVLDGASVSYVKWDMNRCLTEVYSAALPPQRQGEVFHRYVLGVYALYQRLLDRFPDILFESCASGGARFDPGMLYYAPQAWASDDTDAAQRLEIQYGTSFVYPVSSIGAHVSASPNEQLGRVSPLKMRGDVAVFGTFGYELDLAKLPPEDLAEMAQQITLMKQYRQLIQFGRFYRLASPFVDGVTAWMVVNGEQTEALVGWYRVLNAVNAPFSRLPLAGLLPDVEYVVEELGQPGEYGAFTGRELTQIGLLTGDGSCGIPHMAKQRTTDFMSRLYHIVKK